MFNLIFLALALAVWPIAFMVTCAAMHEQKLDSRPYFRLFVAFGITGGWFLAFGFSPSGMTASCIVFLMTIGFIAALITALSLIGSRKQSKFHAFSFYACATHAGLLMLGFVVAQIIKGVNSSQNFAWYCRIRAKP